MSVFRNILIASSRQYPETATIFDIIVGDNNRTFYIFLTGDAYVNWGDGTEDESLRKTFPAGNVNDSGNILIHTYTESRTYTVTVYGEYYYLSRSQTNATIPTPSNHVSRIRHIGVNLQCAYGMFGSQRAHYADTVIVDDGVRLVHVGNGNSEQLFRQCPIVQFPTDFSFGDVTNINNFFYNVGIPALGANQCAALSRFNTPIPEGVERAGSAFMVVNAGSGISFGPNFKIPNSLWYANQMFANNTNNDSDVASLIPESWSDMGSVQVNTKNMFYQNTHLTGSVPADRLWNGSTTFSNHETTFYNCTNLANYTDIPTDWK